MTNKLFLALLLVAASVFAMSCKNDSEVREEAAQEATNQPKSGEPNSLSTKANQEGKQDVPAGPTTTIEFEETTYDFGTIKQGEKASHVFKFRNTGNEPLIISNAKATCGCTVPHWPKDPIAPGETGEIEVVFNSKGKSNKQNKKVTITANTNPPQSFVYLTGFVEAPPKPKNPQPANQ